LVLVNASRRFRKGQPKNFLPPEDIRAIAAMYQKGEAVTGELAVISQDQAKEADYNLSPSRWAAASSSAEFGSLSDLLADLTQLDEDARESTAILTKLLKRVGKDGNS
jgi:type I restriction enzyme M protein